MAKGKRSIAIAGTAAGSLILVFVALALSYRGYLQYRIAEARAIRSPHGIESLEPVRIGGIDQLIGAYVGVAQAVKMRLIEQTAYEDALEVAQKRRRADAIRDLESIQPYPSPGVDLRKGSIAQTWQAELLGPPADRKRFLDMRRILSTLLTAPEYSLLDVYGSTHAQLFSLEVLIPEVRKVDLTTLGADFRAPIFFFQGRHDPYCRPALIEKYAGTIAAPRHEIVWFDDAGHFPFFEDQQRFTDELVRRVLPLGERARQ
jgi:pimeloyl-ACP methyl ester carboxylesterase